MQESGIFTAGSIWATYSTFVNTDGGIILLGVEEVSDNWMKPELVEQVQLMQVKLILHIQNEQINGADLKTGRKK